jgi:hypothetical protein
MQTKGFQRNVEDFECEYCHTPIKGNGYTNHCSMCLWSKHVDIQPGDRKATCGGLMKPIRIEFRNGDYYITHECQTCRFTRNNRVGNNDNFDNVVKIAKDTADKLVKEGRI